MKELTPSERQMLKGRAHQLDPVVLVGGEGLTQGVLAEIERALNAHQLIKIRVMGLEREGRELLLGSICSATGAATVQHIGKVLVVYRERAAKPDAAPARSAPLRRRGPRPKPSRPPRGARIRSR
jgi:putative YhbY family RNA-binding protein